MTEPTAYDFADTLGEFDAGHFATKLTNVIREVALGVVTCEDAKKAGKVTIDLSLRRIGTSNQVEVHHKLAFSAPTPTGKRGEESTTMTPLYVGPRGVLSVAPLAQGDMFRARQPAGD